MADSGIKDVMEIEVKIERVGLDGQGVGYDDEKNIYFVPGALPGDLARVSYDEGAKKYRDASLLKIIEPSAERVEPQCQYFQNCGGCDWMQWSYPNQIQAKESTIKHVLARGELQPKEFLPTIAAEKLYHYRNRIQVRQDNGKMGFYRRGSHDVVDIEECKVAAPEINAELKKLREEPRPATPTKVELYLDKAGKVHRFENTAHSAGGFSQVHGEQNQKLIATVSQIMQSTNARLVLELFCGDGNLTYGYLPYVKQVIGVDGSKPAIESARIQKTEVDGTKVMFLEDQIDRSFTRKLPPELRRYDTLLMDPPRQGMRGVLANYLHPELRTVVYVSCSPVTFSQDVQCLKTDFDLISVQPIDMFPHTKHIEIVAVWQRRSS